jgi:N-acetyl-alpha-D-muramate 1-phosphate uridylyltransferase
MNKATAMILAAGRGERMRPLTDHTPKPMLPVRGKPLIQWHVEALALQGNQDMLVNTAWLGEQVESGLGGGGPFKTHIHYSHEGKDFGHALETAGGIIRALPQAYEAFAASPMQAHVFLVPNPVHNPQGDFGLSQDGLALNLAKDSLESKWTYSTIGLYKQSFFDESKTGISAGNPHGVRAALAPLLRASMDKGFVSAEIYHGEWTDVGTPERLLELNR